MFLLIALFHGVSFALSIDSAADFYATCKSPTKENAAICSDITETGLNMYRGIYRIEHGKKAAECLNEYYQLHHMKIYSGLARIIEYIDKNPDERPQQLGWTMVLAFNEAYPFPEACNKK